MIQIDIASRTPLFEQIKNQITGLVISGVLKPHDQIPSIRNLAQSLKLNVNTVKKAYSELEQAGVIYTLTGRGSYIAQTALLNDHLKSKALLEIQTALKIGFANGVSKELILKIVADIYDQAH